MSSPSTASAVSSTEKRGIQLPYGAIGCIGIHAICARAIWPTKTAEHWAVASGCKPRMAKYWLAGCEVSADGKLAIIRLLH